MWVNQLTDFHHKTHFSRLRESFIIIKPPLKFIIESNDQPCLQVVFYGKIYIWAAGDFFVAISQVVTGTNWNGGWLVAPNSAHFIHQWWASLSLHSTYFWPTASSSSELTTLPESLCTGSPQSLSDLSYSHCEVSSRAAPNHYCHYWLICWLFLQLFHCKMLKIVFPRAKGDIFVQFVFVWH